MSYIDLHCDTLLHALGAKEEQVYSLEHTMVDAKRLHEAGALAQFFAVFFPPKHPPRHAPPPPRDGKPHFRPPVVEDEIAFFRSARRVLWNTIETHGDVLAFAGNGKELEQNISNGKVSAFLTLEDGRAVDGSWERLQWFYEQGVRLITLTWNFPNCFGNPNSRDEEKMRLGLTDFGKEAVGRMNELGILIDVSHLSDGGFYDVASLSKAPFVASHSNCRALTPHPRNLTDDMIRTLADHGGVAGLNFGPDFVAAEAGSHRTSVERLCAHASHLLRIGGEDVVAIGTDFDGVEGDLEICQPTEMLRLFEGLKAAGYTERQIEKAARGNAKRVISETLR